MDESKVFPMQIVVERKCVNGNPKVRLYLSEMQKSKWPDVKKICKKVLFMIYRILFSSAVTFMFGIWAMEWACLDRGYHAYGGEYLLIVLVFFVAFKISGVKND